MSTTVGELSSVIKFLMGEAPLEGVWFNERHPTKKGLYWWRGNLRAALTPPSQLTNEQMKDWSSGLTVAELAPHTGITVFRSDTVIAVNRVLTERHTTCSEIAPTPEMIDAGAQRLVRFEEGSVWPDDFDPLDVMAARNDAERVWRSMALAQPTTPAKPIWEQLAEIGASAPPDAWNAVAQSVAAVVPEHADINEWGKADPLIGKPVVMVPAAPTPLTALERRLLGLLQSLIDGLDDYWVSQNQETVAQACAAVSNASAPKALAQPAAPASATYCECPPTECHGKSINECRWYIMRERGWVQPSTQPAAPVEPSNAIIWVPVAERLPDAETTVLIAHDDDVTLGWFDDDGPRWWECESGELAHGVTHWADLPAAPEVK